MAGSSNLFMILLALIFLVDYSQGLGILKMCTNTNENIVRRPATANKNFNMTLSYRTTLGNVMLMHMPNNSTNYGFMAIFTQKLRLITRCSLTEMIYLTLASNTNLYNGQTHTISYLRQGFDYKFVVDGVQSRAYALREFMCANTTKVTRAQSILDGYYSDIQARRDATNGCLSYFDIDMPVYYPEILPG